MPRPEPAHHEAYVDPPDDAPIARTFPVPATVSYLPTSPPQGQPGSAPALPAAQGHLASRESDQHPPGADRPVNPGDMPMIRLPSGSVANANVIIESKIPYSPGKTPGGADIQFEEWLARFRTYASMYSWSPQERRRELLMHLTDSAYRLISRLIMPSDVTDEEAERLMIEKLQTVYGSTERKAFQKLIALSFDPLKAHNSIDLHAAEIRELIAISLPRLDASSAEMLACRFFWNSIPWTGAASQLYCTWQSSAQDLSHALDLCRTLYDESSLMMTSMLKPLSYLLLLQLLSSHVTRVKASLPKVWAIIKEAARAKGKLKANGVARVAKAARANINALMRLPLIHSMNFIPS
ncbi:hypothetical protein FOZ63_003562 [Perkinsus olseni]|nr:hypothetical protein FOZ63_003562 [Perkinsus olseni]